MAIHPAPADAFAAVYDVLATAYLKGPTEINVTEFPHIDELLDLLAHIEPVLSSELGKLIECSKDLERSESDFLERVFLPIPGHYVPPYASVHLDGTLWGPTTFEVLSWYAEEDLVWNSFGPGKCKTHILAPDHLGIELAFLAIASERSAGKALHTRTNLQLMRSVLSHLATWLPKFLYGLSHMGPRTTSNVGAAAWTSLTLKAVQTDLVRRGGTPGSQV